jgi:NAD(P)-dependent dehydrogenase (short-subunit alcohol dehydrogenase family)
MAGLLQGRSGLVTGAAGGIGRGIAVELAREGANVVVSDLDAERERAQETVALCEAHGVTGRRRRRSSRASCSRTGGSTSP